MNTVVEGYERDTFPYYPILEELTDDIRVGDWSALEAYYNFDRRRHEADLTPYIDYASTAVTTGGHARREDLTVPEIIEANTITARRIASHLHHNGSIEGREVVLPVDLGNTGWKQAEFMKFWILVLSGVDCSSWSHRPLPYGQLETAIDRGIQMAGVDLLTMNNKDVSRAEKSDQFAKFALGMAAGVRSVREFLQPARALRQFVDTTISLGCFGEAVFADELKIPKHRLVALQPASDEMAAYDEPLKEEVKIMRAHDADITVAAAGTTLRLQRNNERAIPVETILRLV